MIKTTSTKTVKTIFMLVILFLSACTPGGPSKEFISDYIEENLIPNYLSLKNIQTRAFPEKGSGRISVSGKLVLTEDLYQKHTDLEDIIENKLKENGFTDKELNHKIYENLISKAVNRKSYLLKEHHLGVEIPFSAEFYYRETVNGYIVEEYPKNQIKYLRLQGKPKSHFKEYIDNTNELISFTVKKTVAEKRKWQQRYLDVNKILTKLWEIPHGFVTYYSLDMYHYKTYGSKIKIPDSLKQRVEPHLKKERPVFYITNIKPVNLENRSNSLYSLGEFETSGTATCLKQVGFDTGYEFRTYSNSEFCEIGEKIPVHVQFGSYLNNKNKFNIWVKFKALRDNSTTFYFNFDGEASGKWGTHSTLITRGSVRIDFLKKPFNIVDYQTPKKVAVNKYGQFILDYSE